MVVTSEENLFAERYDAQVVITLPEEIDLSATIFCDSSGMAAIATAYRQAVAAGADMRLVIEHPAPRRVFEINGFDTLISIYPDLPTALTGRQWPTS